MQNLYHRIDCLITDNLYTKLPDTVDAFTSVRKKVRKETCTEVLHTMSVYNTIITEIEKGNL